MKRTAAEGADAIGGRVVQSRPKLWLLLSGRRTVVTALASVGTFLVLVAFGVLAPAPLRSLMGEPPTTPLFQAMIISVVTGVTLVVTIAQLVLSQELGTAGEQQERMEEALSYQRSVEGQIDDEVAPVQSAEFVRALVVATSARAGAVATAANDVADVQVRERIQRHASDVEDDAAVVADLLGGNRTSTFSVVFPALQFDYTRKMHEARRLRDETDDLPAAVTDALDDLVEALTYFGSAREHVKTLYFQGELINLARDVVYAGIPALLVAIGMVLYSGTLTELGARILGIDVLVLIVSAAATVAVLPFLILLAYILRIVTITQLTLAIGPLELQETVQPEETE